MSDTRNDGAAAPDLRGGSFARADLSGVYMTTRLWGGLAIAIAAAVSAVFADRPELWLLAPLALPTIVHSRLYWRSPRRSLMSPLLIDATAVGMFSTIAGVNSVTVAFAMMMITGSAILVPRRRLRVLFPYIAVWMATALGVSWVYDLPSRWNRPAEVAFSVAHVLIAMGTIGYLVALVMQRLRQVEKERSHLIGGFTHDMKNALTGAVGMADLLANHREALSDEEIDEYASMGLHKSMEAVAMIDDLLTIERAETGNLEIETEAVDLAGLAEETVRMTGVEADVTLDDDTSSGPTRGEGDPGKIRQILRNLLSNADRYGGDRVRISVGGDDTTVFLRVVDDGDPIPDSEQERTFDPYERATHIAQHADSVGLGLFISRHLARLMGGDVTYRHVDGWSVFELTLPRAVQQEVAQTVGS